MQHGHCLVTEEKFHVGALLELQLEFRTSENTGVLLSVSEPEGYPALSLELNDGKVTHQFYCYSIFYFSSFVHSLFLCKHIIQYINIKGKPGKVK